ncbi:MAG: cytochrome c family protein [Gammaproteobacteria bacterium]|nr:cytochrome c family protein [Gammaproteobacteria bacterium]
MPDSLRFAIAVFGLSMLMTACAEQVSNAPAAGGSTPAAPAAADSYDINALMASADPAKGQIVFLQCRACHSLEAAGPNKVGPNLHGIMGRKAGLTPGFSYSEVMAGSDVVWDVEALDKFLLRPSDFMPGTRMVFVGLRKPEDRANVIAYVQQETGAAK